MEGRYGYQPQGSGWSKTWFPPVQTGGIELSPSWFQCSQQAGHPPQLSLSYNYIYYVSLSPPPSSLAALAPTTPNPNFLLLSASSQPPLCRGWAREKAPEAIEAISPPPCPLPISASSVPFPSLLPPLSLAKAARAPGEALPGGASRGLICCHLISICWYLGTFSGWRPGEAAGVGKKKRSLEEGPVQFLPGLAGPLQASALTVPVQRPGACLCQLWGLGGT